MKDQHKKIVGYRDLTQAEIDMKNEIALAESDVATLWQRAKDVVTHHILSSHDTKPEELHEAMRQASLARTHFEQAFMHLSRAVLRPVSPWVKEGEPRQK